MNYKNFSLNYTNYKLFGELQFGINNKNYKFNFEVYSPDCDDYMKNINAHYFVLSKVNQYGATEKSVEYADCFENLANNFGKKKYLQFFYLDVNKEFGQLNIQEIQQLFLEINEIIKKELVEYFNL